MNRTHAIVKAGAKDWRFKARSTIFDPVLGKFMHMFKGYENATRNNAKHSPECAKTSL